MRTALRHVNIDQLTADLATTTTAYANARPYPHIVLENVLTPAAFAAACAEFPTPDGAEWKNYVHFNERKYANTNSASWGPTLQAIADELMSPEFVTYLSTLTGIPGLLPDPSLDGGGLHASGRGGFLNVHADFTTHHTVPGWWRRVNMLVYLNPTWDEAWGGGLEMWDETVSECLDYAVPLPNRAVVFTTTETSFHGHPEPMTCPESAYRQSLALYYFTETDHAVTRSTNYQARPGDGVKRIGIAADRMMLHGYDVLKRRLHLKDDAVSRVLGRVTRRRRRGPGTGPKP